MTTQETLDALDEAGRLLAPILQAEATDRGNLGEDVPSVQVGIDGHFTVHGFIGRTGNPKSAVGRGESLSAAFVKFLADRSDKLKAMEAEAADRAEFEAFKAFKAQRQQVAA